MPSQPSSAPLWRRFAALLYDSLIIVTIALAYTALLTLIDVLVLGNMADNYQPMLSGPLPSIGLILSIALYYCWFWRKSGQTIGMRSWRIQLINIRGTAEPPPWSQCALRCAVGIPAFWLLGLGYWYRFFNRERLCLHDRLSQTRVRFLPPHAAGQAQG